MKFDALKKQSKRLTRKHGLEDESFRHNRKFKVRKNNTPIATVQSSDDEEEGEGERSEDFCEDFSVDNIIRRARVKKF